MSATNQTTVNLVGSGGTPPYSFAIVAGAGTTIPATLSGTSLIVDATGLAAGTYTVQVKISDQRNGTVTKTITVQVVDSSQFSFLNRDVALQPTILPFNGTLPLTTTGGTGAITYSILPQVTTLSGASISGSTLSFTLNAVGSWAVGLRATDSLGLITTRVLTVTAISSSVISVVDGNARILLAPTEDETGTHQFTLTVNDSAASTARSTFTYTIDSPISSVDISETAIDYVWAPGDETAVVYPITADLSGFALGAGTSVVAANGLTATIDPTTNSVKVVGPPTAFGNAGLNLPIAIIQGSTQVATVTRSFTLLSRQGADDSDFGSIICSPQTYIVGQLIGLNPQRPGINSPSIFKHAGYVVSLATGSTLPQGLSLDATTGLIYGTVLAADVRQSVLQYIDQNSVVQGIITINWDIVTSQFQLLSNLVTGEIQASYSATIASSSSALLASATVYRGTLPAGLSLSLSSDSTHVILSGTPTSAGYYDLWLQVTNADGQIAYLYVRLVIFFITPLTIVTDSLLSIQTGSAYAQTLRATGGVEPYAWSVVGGTLPTNLTLNPASGALTGTTTDTSFSQNVTFEVTDARGVVATQVVPLAINNTLLVTTAVLPVILPGVNYSYQLSAQGGQGSYTWSLGTGSAALPGGVTLSASGVLSGATSLTSYNSNIIVQVTDTANNRATATFVFTIGAAFNLLIDIEGIGPMVRGASYSGRLAVIGNGVAPYKWSVTPDSPNGLPSGFTLTADTATNGATATLAGKTTSSLLNDSVKVQVVDANGNSAVTFLLLDTYSSLRITTVSLPQATVTGNYSTTLANYGVNPTYTWSLDPSSPAMPSGLSLSSSGVLAGVPSAAFNVALVFRVTDSIGDFATATIPLVAMASTLAITTTTLPQVTAGRTFSTPTAATGGQAPYTWSVSPTSAAVLPSGLALDPGTGTINGLTTASGFNKNITFRVTDSINVYREVTLPVVVVVGIALVTGPDYIIGLTTGNFGLIANGDVSTISGSNLSFLLVETNAIGTSAGNFSFGVPAGFSVSFLSLQNGAAYFRITGPFGGGSPGDHSMNISVTDSGVSYSTTLHWTVYSPNSLRLAPDNGSLPTR